ncbi:hypothetical protein [Gluconacetobacter sp.]|uniref:hypothetical protein n=1 Tax=Gluconacetobacter sp. TaxID=1935994 RepID=UPI0039E824D9
MPDNDTTPDPAADAKAGTAFQDVFDEALRPNSRAGLNFFAVTKGLGGHMSNAALRLPRGKGGNNGQ